VEDNIELTINRDGGGVNAMSLTATLQARPQTNPSSSSSPPLQDQSPGLGPIPEIPQIPGFPELPPLLPWNSNWNCLDFWTVSANDKQFVQELRTDQVINYKSQNFEDLLHDYDAVFDTVAGETYRRSFKVLKKGSGIIVSMLEQPSSELMHQYGIKAIFQFTQVNRERLTKLAQWVDQNNIRVNVEKTFSLDEAGKALDYQKDVHPRGKVVILAV
jgi:Zinc-binding dehydrogenase